jgi:hypothetical protein
LAHQKCKVFKRICSLAPNTHYSDIEKVHLGDGRPQGGL